MPARAEPPGRAPASGSASANATFMRDSFAATAFADVLDRSTHALAARFTGGLSPIALANAFSDWACHLAFLPGKRLRLVEKALRKQMRLAQYMAQRTISADTPPCIDPLPQDHRFDDERWRQPPFDAYWQAFLLTQQWWHNATTDVRGVSPRNENIVRFTTRQLLDVVSPSNTPWYQKVR